MPNKIKNPHYLLRKFWVKSKREVLKWPFEGLVITTYKIRWWAWPLEWLHRKVFGHSTKTNMRSKQEIENEKRQRDWDKRFLKKKPKPEKDEDDSGTYVEK